MDKRQTTAEQLPAPKPEAIQEESTGTGYEEDTVYEDTGYEDTVYEDTGTGYEVTPDSTKDKDQMTDDRRIVEKETALGSDETQEEKDEEPSWEHVLGVIVSMQEENIQLEEDHGQLENKYTQLEQDKKQLEQKYTRLREANTRLRETNNQLAKLLGDEKKQLEEQCTRLGLMKQLEMTQPEEDHGQLENKYTQLEQEKKQLEQKYNRLREAKHQLGLLEGDLKKQLGLVNRTPAHREQRSTRAKHKRPFR